MDRDVQSRIGRNEGIFREINEGILRGGWPGEEDSPVGFRCECARLGCNLVLELSVSAYEQVRAHPRRFVVAPGHEQAGVETVVENRPGYVVVEKLERAGEIAEANRPRD